MAEQHSASLFLNPKRQLNAFRPIEHVSSALHTTSWPFASELLRCLASESTVGSVVSFVGFTQSYFRRNTRIPHILVHTLLHRGSISKHVCLLNYVQNSLPFQESFYNRSVPCVWLVEDRCRSDFCDQAGACLWKRVTKCHKGF